MSAVTTPWHRIISRRSKPLTKNIGIGSFSVIISISIKIEHPEPCNVISNQFNHNDRTIFLTGLNASLLTLTNLSVNVFFQFLTNVEEITNVYKSAFFPTITNVYYIYGCRHEEEIEESRKRHEVT